MLIIIRNAIKKDNIIKKTILNRFKKVFLLLYDFVIKINNLL